MNSDELQQLIAERLNDFYKRRMQKIDTLKLKQVLRRKNPYLFKALGSQNANEIVSGLLAAYLSSSDEGLFGDAFFEPIAKAISGGVVSPSEGVDVAIETDKTYKAIAVKSGPNPFNSSQRKRQDDEFRSLRSRLMKLRKQFDPILGHGYGKSQAFSKAVIYRDLAGQEFWEELSGDPDFYLKLIRHMQSEIILKHRQEYQAAWDMAMNRYTREFSISFCDERGNINWEALLEFNSGKSKPSDIQAPPLKKSKKAK
jgi:hypothetical protein